MDYNKNSIKQSLTIEEIYSVLEEFGANPSIHGDTIMADTICHNVAGEGSHKLYYYGNTKLFKCYTGCGDYFDIFELMIKVYDTHYGEEISLRRAVSYIATRFGKEGFMENGFEEYVSKDWEYLKSLERFSRDKETRVISLKEYNEEILSRLVSARVQPWIDEGISREAMRRYEILYYPKSAQIVIPHRSIDGKLVGVRGRTLVKEDEVHGKYRPIIINSIMYNHPLGYNLYGLYQNSENIKIAKKAIVFEGEKSVMLYDSIFGAENNISVASCGSSISNYQFELLLSLGIEELVIAFDKQYNEIGDDEFKKLVALLKSIGAKFNKYVKVTCLFDKTSTLDYKSSPIDHGRETFLNLFQNRINL